MITIIKNYNESNAVMQYLLQFFDNLIGVCQKKVHNIQYSLKQLDSYCRLYLYNSKIIILHGYLITHVKIEVRVR